MGPRGDDFIFIYISTLGKSVKVEISFKFGKITSAAILNIY